MHIVSIINDSAQSALASLSDESIDCIVTSPPYWGLRDYGVDGQIGLEPTMAEYLSTVVSVCRELRRVLKPEGTFWLNVGDSYAGSGRGGNPDGSTKQTTNKGSQGVGVLYGLCQQDKEAERARIKAQFEAQKQAGLKPKDLCMVPNRLAILLQEDGWYVRSEIIWHKPNPMPESVRDRPTCAHEKVWLLTKSERYFYDADAIREPLAASSVARLSQDVEAQDGSTRANGGQKTNGKMKAVVFGGNKGQGAYGSGSRRASGNAWSAGTGANARNVWTIPPNNFKEAHFATMPPKIAERCIKAGCPEGGTVLDPFGGAGTTGMVAASLGRNATLIELNPEYCRLAESRITKAGGFVLSDVGV